MKIRILHSFTLYETLLAYALQKQPLWNMMDNQFLLLLLRDFRLVLWLWDLNERYILFSFGKEKPFHSPHSLFRACENASIPLCTIMNNPKNRCIVDTVVQGNAGQVCIVRNYSLTHLLLKDKLWKKPTKVYHGFYMFYLPNAVLQTRCVKSKYRLWVLK